MGTLDNPAFVFIHSAWRSAKTWCNVGPLLAEKGSAAHELGEEL